MSDKIEKLPEKEFHMKMRLKYFIGRVTLFFADYLTEYSDHYGIFMQFIFRPWRNFYFTYHVY